MIFHKPSLGSLDVPQKIWARSVQPFWRLLDTNNQTDRQTPKQTDKPNLYRYRPMYICIRLKLYQSLIVCTSVPASFALLERGAITPQVCSGVIGNIFYFIILEVYRLLKNHDKINFRLLSIHYLRVQKREKSLLLMFSFLNKLLNRKDLNPDPLKYAEQRFCKEAAKFLQTH